MPNLPTISDRDTEYARLAVEAFWQAALREFDEAHKRKPAAITAKGQ